ncbi:MAG: hypothetical protein HC817_03155 [Saprospiraceae bacterium]|nr:hypothetical protein [Saprospiraceae bacterium]
MCENPIRYYFFWVRFFLKRIKWYVKRTFENRVLAQILTKNTEGVSFREGQMTSDKHKLEYPALNNWDNSVLANYQNLLRA